MAQIGSTENRVESKHEQIYLFRVRFQPARHTSVFRHNAFVCCTSDSDEALEVPWDLLVGMAEMAKAERWLMWPYTSDVTS